MERLQKITGHLVSNNCSKQAYERNAELTIWDVSNPQNIMYKSTIFDTNEIKSILAKKGVGFDVWPSKRISNADSDEDVMELYREQIEDIKRREPWIKTVDIVNVTAETQERVRNNFLTEHVHPTKEVRLYVSGCLYYYMHLEDTNEVIRIVTPPGCLIVLPSQCKHWADIGDRCDLTVIRFFGQKEGWSAKYTKSRMERRFPSQCPL